MTEPDQIAKALAAIRADLVEIKADVKIAISHGGDIKKLQADVARIDKHLKKLDTDLDAFVNGPPTLEERLKRLEVKQEKDRKTAARETTDAGDKQEIVNISLRSMIEGVRERILAIERLTLKQQGALALVLGVLISLGYAVLHG